MELQYLETMEEHNLEIGDLPEDAQNGIEQINDVIKGMKLHESRGRTVSEKTFKKLRTLDKWVCYEILDMVNETDKNEDELPYTSEEIIDEFDEEHEEEEEKPSKSIANGNKEEGDKIDADLKVAYESGKKTISFDDLKSVSRTAYNIIFDSYDSSGENGVVTSNWSLLETDEYVFTLEKK